MTKLEFERVVPIAINHPSYGPSRLELKRFLNNGKYVYIAQYRSNDWQCSYGTIGKSWDEVSEKLIKELEL